MLILAAVMAAALAAALVLSAWLQRAVTAPILRVADAARSVVMEEIFEMFAQADRTLERTTSGLGVGLSLSRRLIELHGGTLQARSEGLGKGAEFIVRMPALGLEAPAPVRQSASRSSTSACRS